MCNPRGVAGSAIAEAATISPVIAARAAGIKSRAGGRTAAGCTVRPMHFG